MKKLLAPLMLIALTACQSGNVLTSKEQAAFAGQDTVIARVEFSDEALGRKIAISFEPLEVDYKAGYLLVDLDKEEYSKLRADQGMGFKVSVATTVNKNGVCSDPTFKYQTIPSFPCYRTVEETYAAAASIATANPTLATWTDIGDSWAKTKNAAQGYDIRALKLTKNNGIANKPKTFIMAAIHAREYVTAETAIRFAEQLVAGYGTNADITWMLDHQEVHLVFQANPDGRKKAEAGALWRKNANTTYCPSSVPGVDLNRNSTFQWNTGGSSASTCSETYRGPSAGSEPETKAIENYVKSIFPDVRGPASTDAAPSTTPGVFISLHSYSQLVLWPWGNTTAVAPNGIGMQTLGRKFAFLNGYTPQQAVGLYPTSGTTDEFTYGTLGQAAFTFELGTSFFQPCADFTSTILNPNLDALLYAVRVSRAPYLIPSGPDTLSPTLSSGVLSANATDTRFSSVNGTEATQAIAAAEYYIDTPPWAAGAVANTMSATDGAYNTSVEAVTATVSTVGLSSGRHTVFVRSKDAAGNWGSVSAVFLDIP